MIEACEAKLAGECVPWSQVRIIMVTLLGSAAALGFDAWWLEVREG